MRSIRTLPRSCAPSSQMDLFRTDTLTSAALSTSSPRTSETSCSATSSPASADGRRLFVGSDGATTAPSGPPRSHASHSAAPAKSSASTTLVTSGRRSSDSSGSAGLQSCLENSLRTRLHGSALCEVVWIRWRTPWGQSLLKPRARVRSIDGRDTTLWPTTTTSKGGSNNGSKAVLQNGHGTNLVGAVKASLWGTPRVTTNGGRGSPDAPDRSRLEDQVQATASNGSSTTKEKRGALHPEFACWMMGYKVVWLDMMPTDRPATTRASKRSKVSETRLI